MATDDTTSKTVRTRRQAIYAKVQQDGTFANPDKGNLIPISADVSKTFLEDNSIEKPELRGGFGANDSVIISQTQAVSIPSFIQGGTVKSKVLELPPVDPLLCACYHKRTYLGSDGTTKANANGTDAAIIKYEPSDDEVFGASLIYQLDSVQQKMTSAKGTMSLSMGVGEFASMTFEMQSPYTDPTKDAAPTKGTVPPFNQTLAVSGQNTLSVPNLPPQFSGCVRSFSLTQGVTISAIDCANREGGNAIKYVQTARAATGEIVFDIGADQIEELVKVWGGQQAINDVSKFTVASEQVSSALVLLGERLTDNKKIAKNGNVFAVAANNYKIGAPTLGDSDGIATWTFPITFIPVGGKPDYELYYIGDLSS